MMPTPAELTTQPVRLGRSGGLETLRQHSPSIPREVDPPEASLDRNMLFV
jgi:hypothetical protein